MTGKTTRRPASQSAKGPTQEVPSFPGQAVQQQALVMSEMAAAWLEAARAAQEINYHLTRRASERQHLLLEQMRETNQPLGWMAAQAAVWTAQVKELSQCLCDMADASAKAQQQPARHAPAHARVEEQAPEAASEMATPVQAWTEFVAASMAAAFPASHH